MHNPQPQRVVFALLVDARVLRIETHTVSGTPALADGAEVTLLAE